MRNLDKQYLKMAKIWSKNSYSKRLKVGALIVSNNSIIGDGYNGTPHGFDNNCETEDGTTKDFVLHAEANAIMKVAKSNNSSEGSTLYTIVSPCLQCAKLIIQAGIIRVVYSSEYRDKQGLILLEIAGIKTLKVDISTNWS